jgi:hypothetical protein
MKPVHFFKKRDARAIYFYKYFMIKGHSEGFDGQAGRGKKGASIGV